MVEGDGDQGGKNLKLHWLQCPKTVPKNKIWSWNWMIKKLIFGADILISDFLVESLKANKNYQKNDHSFYNVVSLKNFTLRTSNHSPL